MLAACSALAFTVSRPAHAAAAPIKLGAYVPNAPEDGNALDSYADMVGGMPGIVMKYSNVTDPLLTPTEISNLESRDEAAMVTWQLYKSGWSGPTISLSDIAAGDYDRDLRRAADLAKGLPFQVMIRFGHEMNGDWYPWSGKPAAYVAAWRHSVSVFRQEGADNVKWVWSPNVEQGNYPFARYFPGNAWVDYVGLDGYNWGTSGVGTDRWQSLSQVFAASYKHLTEMSSKPVIICETSSSDAGGDKAEWIRNGLLKTIPQEFPRVRAVMWFDRSMEQDWRVDSSQASLQAFRSVVSSSVYGGPDSAPTAAPASSAAVRRLRVTRSRASAHSGGAAGAKVVYGLSKRAPVRIAVRGGGSAGGAVTVRKAKQSGRIPLSDVVGRNRIQRGSYRVVAKVVGPGARHSKSRQVRFRVV
jgi:Glycosyl hydrolase family 26